MVWTAYVRLKYYILLLTNHLVSDVLVQRSLFQNLDT